MKQIPNEIQSRVDDKLTEMLKKVNDRYNKTIERPVLDYTLKGGCAGKANRDTIYMNNGLMFTETDEQINATLPHEFAHSVVFQLYPQASQMVRSFGAKKRTRLIQPHGKEWKAVMRVLGADDSRTHKMDVSDQKKQVQRFDFRCDCMTHRITSKRRNKMLRGVIYTCKSCKTRLVPGTYSKTAPAPIPKDVPQDITKVPVMKTKAKAPATDTRSKTERARAIYEDMYYGADRSTIIETFMRRLNMTKAGATTYYSNCKRHFGH